MELKEKIKEIRKRLHLTQEKFAEGLGLETSYIGQTETGKKIPGRKTIQKICTVYDIDPREFFETEKQPTVKKKDILTAEIETLPKDKKDTILKIITSIKDMELENIRDVLKHTEKEKYWKAYLERKRTRKNY